MPLFDPYMLIPLTSSWLERQSSVGCLSIAKEKRDKTLIIIKKKLPLLITYFF